MVRRRQLLKLPWLLLLLSTAWLACDESQPTGSGHSVSELLPGEAFWAIGRSDRFIGLAVYQDVAATPDFDARANIYLSTTQEAKGATLEVSIRLPEIVAPSTYTEIGCEAFVDVEGYPLPVPGVETRWKSCCAIRRVYCTPGDIHCGILEVRPEGILGTFRAQLFYQDGFSVHDSTEIDGAFFAPASE